jgi:hypothetical protein
VARLGAMRYSRGVRSTARVRRLATALACALAVAAVAACAGPARDRPASVGAPLPEGLDAAAAREVLLSFAGALEQGRFHEAHALLSARWRTRTTPARLGTDWRGAGAVGREAAARARASRPEAVSLEPGRARVEVGDGRAAVLVAEGRAWRVDALE